MAGFPTRIDPNVLEVALRATLDDLPFLAGRLGGMKGVRSPLGALYIAHTGDGVPLTVAEAPGTSLADVGPDSWPQTDCTIADPHWPWYLERMDVGRR